MDVIAPPARDVFDAVAPEYGGALPDEIGHVHYNPWDVLRNFYYNSAGNLQIGRFQDAPMSLQVGVTNDVRFNARARHLNGVDLVIFNLGVFHKTKLLLEAMLSHKAVFPLVGSSHGNVPFTAEERWVYGSMQDGTSWPSPLLNRRRVRLAQLINIVMLDLVYQHELAHIWYGHVNWVSNCFSASDIDELNMAGIAGLSGLDAQTLEWDADKFSIINVLGPTLSVEQGEDDRGQPKWSVPETNRFGTIEDAVSIFSFAAYTCFSLFSITKSTDVDEILSHQSHPPALVRLSTAMNMTGSMLNQRSGLPRYRWVPAFQRGATFAAIGLAAITDGQPDDLFTPQNFALINELKSRYRANWADKIYEELLPWKRGPAINDRYQPAPIAIDLG